MNGSFISLMHVNQPLFFPEGQLKVLKDVQEKNESMKVGVPGTMITM